MSAVGTRRKPLQIAVTDPLSDPHLFYTDATASPASTIVPDETSGQASTGVSPLPSAGSAAAATANRVDNPAPEGIGDQAIGPWLFAEPTSGEGTTSDDPVTPPTTGTADAEIQPPAEVDTSFYRDLLARANGEEDDEAPGADNDDPPAEEEPGETDVELPGWWMTEAHDGWAADRGQVEVWRDFIVKGIDEVQYEIDAGIDVDAISKSFETVAEQTYKVSFALSQRPGVSIGGSQVSVFWNGELMGTVAPTEPGWNSFEFHVIGDGEPGRLTFSDVEEQSDSYGAILDAVRVVAEEVAPAEIKTLPPLSSASEAAPLWHRPWQGPTSGDDLLTGSPGREQFLFVAGDAFTKDPIDFGHDTIANFEKGDVLGFFDLASIDELTIRNVGADTLITRGNSSILIKNYQSESWADQIELHENHIVSGQPTDWGPEFDASETSNKPSNPGDLDVDIGDWRSPALFTVDTQDDEGNPVEFGNHTIVNFKKGDLIHFRDIESAENLTIESVGDDTVVRHGQSSIVLKNVKFDAGSSPLALGWDKVFADIFVGKELAPGNAAIHDADDLISGAPDGSAPAPEHMNTMAPLSAALVQHDGWTADSGQIKVYRDSTVVEGEDAYLYEIDAGQNVDAISKTFETVDGQTYKVSFALHADFMKNVRSDVPSDTSHVSVFWNGELMGTVAPNSYSWNRFEFHVTGDGQPGRLTFSEVASGNDGYGAFLDAVRVVADDVAPENFKTLPAIPQARDASQLGDLLYGTSESESFSGTNGDDRFHFFTADTFSKDPLDFGHDTVANFGEGDLLVFWNLTSSRDFDIREVGADTLITLGNSSILVQKFQSESWANFITIVHDSIISLDDWLGATKAESQLIETLSDPLMTL